MAGRRVLVVGSGAREHALTWKLRQSPRVDRLWCAPGNAGTEALATNVPIPANQIGVLVDWCAANRIDLVVVGPEEPLALGLVDRLAERGILALGPTAAAARIEASKSWAKELMRRAGVPTAAYAVFAEASEAWSYARTRPYPLVLKADGLAAGKGVVVAETPTEAHAAIVAALEQRVFGDAGRTLVIEEYLVGTELSLLAFVDGRRVVPLVPACDYKRVGDGDTGPNTGGMGAFAPTHLVDRTGVPELCSIVVEPIVATMRELGLSYRGVLYAGLMLTTDGPRVVEYNCRLGDPETQVVLPLLDDDLAELAEATATGQLPARPLGVAPGYRCGVVLASGGYPGPSTLGVRVEGLAEVDGDALVFHAGTRRVDGNVVTAGGRVLTVVGQGTTLAAARAHAYANLRRIHVAGAHYRTDIGLREARG